MECRWCGEPIPSEEAVQDFDGYYHNECHDAWYEEEAEKETDDDRARDAGHD